VQIKNLEFRKSKIFSLRSGSSTHNFIKTTY
jgi:hypothetical protein